MFLARPVTITSNAAIEKAPVNLFFSGSHFLKVSSPKALLNNRNTFSKLFFSIAKLKIGSEANPTILSVNNLPTSFVAFTSATAIDL
ncbi:hypothetical protein D3C78_1603910 [compost metagenome]